MHAGEEGSVLRRMLSTAHTSQLDSPDRSNLPDQYTPLRLFCRKIGDHASAIRCDVHPPTDPMSQAKLQVREYLVPRPHDFPAAGIKIEVKVRPVHLTRALIMIDN